MSPNIYGSTKLTTISTQARRIATIFSTTTNWKRYDVFSRQKLSTFKSSRPAVIELAARYKDLITQLDQKKPSDEDPQAEELLFSEFAQICLWGNATDLSLLTNLTYSDIQKLQGSSVRKEQEKSIVANDIPRAFKSLKDSQRRDPDGERRVDILLDNAGFELFVDLILAGYLLHSGLATSIVLHPKDIPWFVSDVIPADFAALLNALADPESFYTSLAQDSDEASAEHGEASKPDYAQPLAAEEKHNLSILFNDLCTLHSDGQLILRPNRAWTQAGSYWRLPTTFADLYEHLRGSELVIAKGDLHYRKLTGDVAWPATTGFAEALGPLGKGPEGLRVLALRTCKADVVVGLGQGVDERLKEMEGGGGDSGKRSWAWSGKWAVVQFVDGMGAG